MEKKIAEDVVSERKVKILPVTKCTILSAKLSNHGLGRKKRPDRKIHNECKNTIYT
jgi:hypothetical protein